MVILLVPLSCSVSAGYFMTCNCAGEGKLAKGPGPHLPLVNFECLASMQKVRKLIGVHCSQNTIAFWRYKTPCFWCLCFKVTTNCTFKTEMWTYPILGYHAFHAKISIGIVRSFFPPRLFIYGINFNQVICIHLQWYKAILQSSFLSKRNTECILSKHFSEDQNIEIWWWDFLDVRNVFYS